MKLIIGLVVLLAAGGGGAYILLSEPPMTPPEKLDLALKLMDEQESSWQIRRALDLMDELDEIRYVDPDFPAGESYVRGMAEFHSGRDFAGDEQQQRYLAAIDHFEEAFPRGMPPERKAEMTWAMGVAYQTVGLSTRARESLEASLRLYPPGRIEASLLLMQNYYDGQSKEGLERALAISDSLPDKEKLSEKQHDQARLLRGSILLDLGKAKEAEQILTEADHEKSNEHQAVILQARTLMSQARDLASRGNIRDSEDRYHEAQELLQSLAEKVIHKEPAAQASFMNALCAERLGNTESAINYYQRTVRTFVGSPEWLASMLRLASLLRQVGRDEEALTDYREILRTVVRPEDFRNRWLTLSQFRDAILLAWSEWLDARKFEEALALSRAMPPLIDKVRSLGFVARTSEEWAQAAQDALEEAPSDRKPALRVEARERWKASGEAHSRFADAIRTEAEFPETLWASALHYDRGYDFLKALELAEEFIRAEPPKGVPRAYVFRGRMLMNLDQLSDSYDSFLYVIENAPTDPSVFEAQYRLGQCQLEMDEPGDAERTWRAILGSEDLAPSANEWRLAKFALGKLLENLASNAWKKSIPATGAEQTPEHVKFRQEAFAYWKEAIKHLDEYLKRYPDSDERIPARQLMARSLQAASVEPRESISDNMPANARAELFREVSRLLNRAVAEYRSLQRQLQELRVDGQLDQYQTELYRSTFMSIPQAQFEQERYLDALNGFRTVTSRFPDHVSVLTAYIQMSRCYSKLDQPGEARRQLEQARVILGRLPDKAFDSQSTSMGRDEWSAWIDWARKVHDGQFRLAEKTL